MKRIIISFYISLLIPTLCFSQNTYPKIINDSLIVITQSQLKQIDLFLLDRTYYKNSDSIKTEQINNYKALIDNYNKSDSIKDVIINNYKDEVIQKELEINKVEKKVSKYKTLNKIKNYIIGVLCGGIGILLIK